MPASILPEPKTAKELLQQKIRDLESEPYRAAFNRRVAEAKKVAGMLQFFLVFSFWPRLMVFSPGPYQLPQDP